MPLPSGLGLEAAGVVEAVGEHVTTLAKGDRAAYAAFHGARALARSGHDDEAVATNLQIVRDYPGSRWAVEAQFVAGWLEFRKTKLVATQEEGLRQLVQRYEQLAENTWTPSSGWPPTCPSCARGRRRSNRSCGPSNVRAAIQ